MIEEIFGRHHKTVYRVCMLYLKNPADAEDMTQNVFLNLLDKKPSFQSGEHEKAWLVRVAVNACKNDLRSFRRKNVPLPPTLAAPETETGETLALVLALPGKYKMPLYLHYFEGYSAVEIAKMLKTREATVRSWLMRGRNLLRMELESS
ncbi:MAG: RNA polymerase sigma factor [Oscillospiraceae bacterium]|jgi:RNA polymerase sigma-70 factor (ECF subfamily)|nr:RNA polymerase sigma factor [Oscillospiraceae bacterium]